MNTVYDSKLKEIWALKENEANGLDWTKIPFNDRRRALFICETCGGTYENFIDLEFARIARNQPAFLCHHKVRGKMVYLKYDIDQYGLIKDVYPQLEREFVNVDGIPDWNHAVAKPSKTYRWKCPLCGHKRMETLGSRLRGDKPCRCMTKRVVIPFSFPEKVMCGMIKRHVDGIIENDRSILDGLELDVFIPKLNIGIEYDGMIYHQSYHVGRDVKKYESCRKHGVVLIRVIETKNGYVANDVSDFSIGISFPLKRDDSSFGKFAKVVNYILETIGIGGNVSLEDYHFGLEYARMSMDVYRKDAKLMDCGRWLKSWYDPQNNEGIEFSDIMTWDVRQYVWRCPDCGVSIVSTPRSRLLNGCPGRCHGEPGYTFSIFQYGIDGAFERIWDSSKECARFFGTSTSYPISVCGGKRKSICGHMLKYAKDVGWRMVDVAPIDIDPTQVRIPFAKRHPELVEMLAPGKNSGFDPYADDANLRTTLWWTVDGLTFRQTVKKRMNDEKPARKCMENPPPTKAELRKMERMANRKISCSDIPEEMSYWDYDKNANLDPSQIGYKSRGQNVHWKCPICGNTWESSPCLFMRRKTKCKKCSEKNKRFRYDVELGNARKSIDKLKGMVAYFHEFRQKYPELYKSAKKFGLFKEIDWMRSYVSPEKIKQSHERRKQPVLEMTKESKIVMWYDSLHSAMRMTGISSLPLALTKRIRTAGKHLWIYEREYAELHPEYDHDKMIGSLHLNQ